MSSPNDLITQVQADGSPNQKAPFPPTPPPTRDVYPCWGVFCCVPCMKRPHEEIQSVYGEMMRPPGNYLLPPLAKTDQNKKTLVLDLDETLVHSSFKPIPDADFKIQIELENVIHTVYVRKRPGVDEFLQKVGKMYEVVVFTASLAKYADPLLDILDPTNIVAARLFREACVQHYGNYVKDLSHLGRHLERTIIVDNSPFSYMFQPGNAIPITSWFSDTTDTQLYELLPFLESLSQERNVCSILQYKEFTNLPPGQAHQHKQQLQLAMQNR